MCGRDVGRREVGPQQPHAAVDVVADAAGADDAVLDVGGDDAADREPVALVDVGHRERRLDDAREGRAVRHLLQRRVTADGRHELVVGVDDPRHPHAGPRVLGDPPEIGKDLLDLHGEPRRWLGPGARPRGDRRTGMRGPASGCSRSAAGTGRRRLARGDVLAAIESRCTSTSKSVGDVAARRASS